MNSYEKIYNILIESNSSGRAGKPSRGTTGGRGRGVSDNPDPEARALAHRQGYHGSQQPGFHGASKPVAAKTSVDSTPKKRSPEELKRALQTWMTHRRAQQAQQSGRTGPFG